VHRVLFEAGPITIYSYGFCVAVAFLVSVILVRKDAIAVGVPANKAIDCLLWVLIGGIVGARLLYVVINFSYFVAYPLKIFAFRDGGMAVHGGLLGGIIAGWASCRIAKISFLFGADLIAPYIALGQAIGRVGCFLNGCCYGVGNIPVQLYYSIGLGMITLVLLDMRKKAAPPGTVILSYFIIYSIFRFLIEFLRADNPSIVMNLTLAQLISAGTLLISVGLLIILRKHGRAKI